MACKDIFPIKDPVKKSLFIPKIFLEAANFWPEKRTTLTKSIGWILLMVCAFIEIGQIAFIKANIKDVAKVINSVSTVSTTFQVIKLPALYKYNDQVKDVLSKVWYEFWPSTIRGPKIERYLKVYTTIIIYAAVMLALSAASFAYGFLSAPIRTGNRILPFEVVYPFDWSKSPLYEVLYVMQWMVNLSFVLVSVVGHDFLFCGICSNIVAQYVLMGDALNDLGTQRVHETNRELAKFTKVTWTDQKSANGELLQRCINHHQMLTEISKTIAEAFSFSALMQLFLSSIPICMATLIFTFAEVDAALIVGISSYLLGHLLQLFLFCTIGNEMRDHAGKLSTKIFSSCWYNLKDPHLKKDLLFFISRAQNVVSLSAYGVIQFNYTTFIEVLRTSFSFYTMISKIAARK